MPWKERIILSIGFFALGFLAGIYYGGVATILAPALGVVIGLLVGDVTGWLGLLRDVIQHRKLPRLEFGELQKNRLRTHFLRVKRTGGEGFAHRCSARIISQELGLDHHTIWNIYQRTELDVKDHEDLILFSLRKDSMGNILIFYVGIQDTGYLEKIIRLEDDKGLQAHLEIALNAEDGKTPMNYRKSLHEIITQAIETNSLGDFGDSYRPFSVR